jgi:hypothetical protein
MELDSNSSGRSSSNLYKWQRHKDAETGEYYWWNQETGASVWEEDVKRARDEHYQNRDTVTTLNEPSSNEETDAQRKKEKDLEGILLDLGLDFVHEDYLSSDSDGEWSEGFEIIDIEGSEDVNHDKEDPYSRTCSTCSLSTLGMSQRKERQLDRCVTICINLVESENSFLLPPLIFISGHCASVGAVASFCRRTANFTMCAGGLPSISLAAANGSFMGRLLFQVLQN